MRLSQGLTQHHRPGARRSVGMWHTLPLCSPLARPPSRPTRRSRSAAVGGAGCVSHRVQHSLNDRTHAQQQHLCRACGNRLATMRDYGGALARPIAPACAAPSAQAVAPLVQRWSGSGVVRSHQCLCRCSRDATIVVCLQRLSKALEAVRAPPSASGARIW